MAKIFVAPEIEVIAIEHDIICTSVDPGVHNNLPSGSGSQLAPSRPQVFENNQPASSIWN